jgi:hypothetical protein
MSEEPVPDTVSPPVSPQSLPHFLTACQDDNCFKTYPSAVVRTKVHFQTWSGYILHDTILFYDVGSNRHIF